MGRQAGNGLYIGGLSILISHGPEAYYVEGVG